MVMLAVGECQRSKDLLQPLRSGFVHLQNLSIIQCKGVPGLSVREIRTFFFQASLPELKRVRLECSEFAPIVELKHTDLGVHSVTHYTGSLYFADLFPAVEVSFTLCFKVGTDEKLCSGTVLGCFYPGSK